MRKIIMMMVLAMMALPALAVENFTPRQIRMYTVDKADEDGLKWFDFIIYHNMYVYGVANTVQTIQNYDVIGRSICNMDSVPNVYAAMKSLNIDGFADTTEGGILYIYEALKKEYPCN